MLCLVDDAHWLDHASAAALVFAARRLDAEGVVVLFAARESGFEAPGLPELTLGGLDADAARALLAERSAGLPTPVREWVLAEACGNPLALQELPAMAGRSPELGPLPLPQRLQEAYLQQIRGLPEPAQTLLLVAAAAENGDLAVVLRAAEALNLTADAAAAAERSGLITIGRLTVTFRHPLIRAAETIVAGRHDAGRTAEAFTRLQAIIASGEARPVTVGDAAAASVEMLIRTQQWILGTRVRSAWTPRDTLTAAGLASLSGDYEAGRDAGLAAAEQCRASGVISLLPFVHAVLAATEIQLDRFGDATVTASEGLRLAADTGQPLQAATLLGHLAWLAALHGDRERCRDLARQAVQGFAGTGNPTGGTWAEWALALLDLSSGHHDAALAQLETTAATPGHRAIGLIWFAADQVEAAARLGSPGRAAQPLTRLTDWAEIAPPQPATEAILHRCRALAGLDTAAEDHYRAALRLHAISGRPYQQARTELLYGEWLRRTRRSSEARTILRGALERFERTGARPWAERARAELRAAGGKTVGTQAPPGAIRLLTPQELQVVRLAATGQTNRDIAAQLFLSPRTVSHHLYRAFPKLGVANRTELARLDLTGHADATAGAEPL